MIKDSVTQFDLEAAFKALDDINMSETNKGLKANKAPLTEIFSKRNNGFEALMEEYYNVGDSNDLSAAQEEREAEIAKAKLARIEKIVDLDAKSPDDLLTSYVGKYIIQCPQCMTLFYKNPEDVEQSDENSGVVNIDEVCQHCGNDTGYTLVGKIGEVTAEEAEEAEEEMPAEAEENSSEEAEDSEQKESQEDEPDESEEDLNLEITEDDILEDSNESESDEKENKEESFRNIYMDNMLLEELEGEIQDDDIDDDSILEELESDELEEDFEDISDAEFQKLIQSPEFKKPISDNEVQQLLGENKSQKNSELTEGIFDKITKSFKKDSPTMSYQEKAEWCLENALKNYAKNKENDEDNKLFNCFIVLGFTDKLATGKDLTGPTDYDNNFLIFGMDKPESYKTFEKAEKAAKGWSLLANSGPAMILLAKNDTDPNAVYLCQFFDGKFIKEQDKIDHTYKAIKKDLEGAELRSQAQQ